MIEPVPVCFLPFTFSIIVYRQSIFGKSRFSVTEENLLFVTVQPGPPTFFSLLLKELTFIFYLHAIFARKY